LIQNKKDNISSAAKLEISVLNDTQREFVQLSFAKMFEMCRSKKTFGNITKQD